MNIVMDKTETVFLDWVATGGGILPAFTVIRVCNNGKIKCLVTNSWMHNSISNEAGTYEMLLPGEDMSVLSLLAESINFSEAETTYGKLYADSGVQTLEIYRNGKRASARWGVNNEDALPKDIQQLCKKMFELFIIAKNFPCQVLCCTLTPGAAGFKFEMKNRGSALIEIRNETGSGAGKACLRYLQMPAASNWYNSSSFTEVFNKGVKLDFVGRIFINPATGPLFLKPGEAVSFSVEEMLAEKQAPQYVVLALANFAATIHWDEKEIVMDFMCLILPPGFN